MHRLWPRAKDATRSIVRSKALTRRLAATIPKVSATVSEWNMIECGLLRGLCRHGSMFVGVGRVIISAVRTLSDLADVGEACSAIGTYGSMFLQIGVYQLTEGHGISV